MPLLPSHWSVKTTHHAWIPFSPTFFLHCVAKWHCLFASVAPAFCQICHVNPKKYKDCRSTHSKITIFQGPYSWNCCSETTEELFNPLTLIYKNCCCIAYFWSIIKLVNWQKTDPKHGQKKSKVSHQNMLCENLLRNANPLWKWSFYAKRCTHSCEKLWQCTCWRYSASCF